MSRSSARSLAGFPDPTVPVESATYLPFAGHSQADVEQALQRILVSRTFRRSPRHRGFLQHVVVAALTGRHDELKETVIGIEVFRRDIADYDPRRDPIVRVEAGRVREKLARYYADEGAGDAFEIRIPVGGYLPQLSRRTVDVPPVRALGSFAVLPFTCLSTDPDDALFCEALVDQLIDMLSRVPGARVVGRLSASKAHAQSLDMKVVGKLLGVGHVIEGSVQRGRTRYRCIAQLFRSRDRTCVWSHRFECRITEHTDLFAFQDEIADAVAAAVVGDRRLSLPTRHASRVPAARDLYERARYLVQVRNNDGLQRGIAMLEKSIALDPDFAPAHSQLGVARSAYHGAMARPELPGVRDVERCAIRALQLDPLDGDARALLANIAFRIDRDWKRAEPMFLEALRVAPNAVIAHQNYGMALVCNGRFVEGLDHARIGLDLDPLNVTARLSLALITAYARDYPTSIEEFRSTLQIEPDHFPSHLMLGMTCLWADAPEEAQPHLDAAQRIAPDHPIASFAQVFLDGARGERAAGRERLDALLARFEGRDHQLYNRAMAEAFIGDLPALCATLRRVAERRERLFVSLPCDPTFDPYRDEPEFIALMREYGLPGSSNELLAQRHRRQPVRR